MRTLVSTPTVKIFALLLALQTGAAFAAAEGAACPVDTPANPDNVLLIDANRLGLVTGDSEITARLLAGGEEILAERYQLLAGSDAEMAAPAFPLYLAAARNGEGLGAAAEAGELRVELIVDGITVAELDFAELLFEDGRLRAAQAEALQVAALETVDAGGPVLANSAVWTCPNSTPFCDNQKFSCMAGCSNYSCRLDCLDEYQECQFGRLTNFNVQRTLISYVYRPAKEKCGYYPWYDFLNEREWRAYDATYRNRRYETRYCETTNSHHTFLASTTYDYPTCYVRSAAHCSSSAYMGDECRWNAPGG